MAFSTKQNPEVIKSISHPQFFFPKTNLQGPKLSPPDDVFSGGS
jgi:hypothetical protein